MILNTKIIHYSFWRNFPARAKQMPSKVLFVGKKKRRLLRSSANDTTSHLHVGEKLLYIQHMRNETSNSNVDGKPNFRLF